MTRTTAPTMTHIPPTPQRKPGPLTSVLPDLSGPVAYSQQPARPAAGFPPGQLAVGPKIQRKCAACGGEDRSSVQPSMEVGPANDAYEQEADQVAARVMRMPVPADSGETGTGALLRPQRACCAACGGSEREKVQPQLENETDEETVSALRIQRQLDIGMDEDATPRAMSIQRLSETDDDMAQPMRIQRQTEASEEEIVQTRRVQRQEESEAEDVLRARRVRRQETEEDELQARRQPETASTAPSLAATGAQLTLGGSPLPEALSSFYEPRLARDLSSVRLHKGDGSSQFNKSIGARAFTYGSHIWLGRNEPIAPTFTMSHEMAHVLQQTRTPRLKPISPQMKTRPAPRVIQRISPRAVRRRKTARPQRQSQNAQAAPGAPKGFPLASLNVQPKSASGKKHKRVRRGNISCQRNGLSGNPQLTGDQVVTVLETADREAIRFARRAEHLLFLNVTLAGAGETVDANFATIVQEELGLDLTQAADRRLALQQSNRFRRIAETLESGILGFTCRSPECDGDEFAFAFEANRIIRLCAFFWNSTEAPLTLAQNQAITLMHETGHILFNMDHSHRLRRANADCFESFALRLAGLPAPNSCVSLR